MSRNVKIQSFTIGKGQIEYLKARCPEGGNYTQSRWVREAIDAKIIEEQEQERYVLENSITSINGDRRNTKPLSWNTPRPLHKTIGDVRTSLVPEYPKDIADTNRDLPSEEDNQS